MNDQRNHSMDEQEFETLDRLQISGSRAETFHKWMKLTSVVLINAVLLILIWAIIFRAIPMMSAIKESSQATAKGWNETITQAGKDIKSASKNLNTITVDAAEGSRDAKRLIKEITDEAPRAIREVAGLVSDGRRQLNGIGGQAQWLIRDSNLRVNGDSGLMVKLTASVDSFDLLVKNSDKVVADLAARAGVAVDQMRDDLHAVLGSPEWAEARAEVVKTLKNTTSITGRVDKTMGFVEVTAEQIAKASAQLPQIAELLKKIANTNSKYQKAILLARIFGILAAGIGALTL
jgi:hypothetical protein